MFLVQPDAKTMKNLTTFMHTSLCYVKLQNVSLKLISWLLIIICNCHRYPRTDLCK